MGEQDECEDMKGSKDRRGERGNRDEKCAVPSSTFSGK
jgi:hypothetical protein